MSSLKPGLDKGGSAEAGRGELHGQRRAAKPAQLAAVSQPLKLEEARHMRGSGWIGDLAELRSCRLGGHRRIASAELRCRP